MVSISSIKTGNRLLTEPKSMADALHKQFHSFFTLPSDTRFMLPPTVTPFTQHTMLKIHREGVASLLQSLKPNKATGPDSITARILKETANITAGPLTNIFRKSLSTATVPEDWKTATVTPIFKKVENHRPISFTCIASKVMEHIVASHIMEIAYSTASVQTSDGKQLVELTSEISAELDRGNEVDACILDFSKTFDRVDHNELVQKMKAIGVNNQLNEWTRTFLRNRGQEKEPSRGHSLTPAPSPRGYLKVPLFGLPCSLFT